jgi:hypothetical protein
MKQSVDAHTSLIVRETYCDQNSSNVWVETVRVVVAVFDYQAIFGRFERAGNVCIHPERPKCIVQVKNHDLRQR